MKGSFNFDPQQCNYGAATGAVRRLLVAWSEIDWFAPPADAAAPERARRLFLERARAHLPDAFPPNVDVRIETGGFVELVALTVRARTLATWDWKYGALKPLSHQHSQARGWTLAAEARDLTIGAGPAPGGLFFRLGEDAVVWNSHAPTLPLKDFVPHPAVEAAAWYLSYANIDLIECLEWQLAEGSSDLDGNPFVPLLGCYREGFYPFSQSRTEMILFALDGDRAISEPCS